MINCPRCNQVVIENSAFCHQCGLSIKEDCQSCTHCQQLNWKQEVICIHCNKNLVNQKETILPETLSALEDATKALAFVKDGFHSYLKQYLLDFGKETQINAYESLLYLEDCKQYLHSNHEMMANQLIQFQKEKLLDQDKLQSFLFPKYEAQIDYFFHHFTGNLNKNTPPEAILFYSHLNAIEVNLPQLVLDYLALQWEDERFYSNQNEIPTKKWNHAQASFLPLPEEETLLFLCDQTIFGSCKEGFAFTTKGLYWKAHFNAAAHIPYAYLREIVLKEWLSINGHYFHVNASLNEKVFKLLRKLRLLFA